MSTHRGLEELTQRISRLEEENDVLRQQLSDYQLNEPRFHAIMNHMKEGYFEVDLNGNFTYFSPAVPVIFGYPAAEILGMNNRIYTAPDVAEKMFNVFSRVYRTGEPAEILDYEVIGRDGVRRYLELSAYLITDEKGKPIGFRGLGRDVTDRKSSESALKESEERFRRLHEASFGGIAIHDNGIILDCNMGLVKMTGYSYAELIGMDGLQVLAPECREAVLGKIVSGYEKPYQAEGIRRNGERFPVEIQGKGILYRGKKVRVTEFRDISEIKRAEDALKESEQRYRQLYRETKRAEEIYQSLLNSSPDAIAIYNMQRQIRYINPAFSKAFGWTLEELQGNRLPYIPHALTNEFEEMLRNVMDFGMPVQGLETRRLTRSGEILDISLSASRFSDHQGEPTGVLIMLRDITEAKKLRLHLLQSQKMESIGTLAGGIAHDFNNLLMGIQGRLSLMMFDLSDENPFHRHMKEIENYVQRSAELTRQLLGFARGGRYEVSATDINELIATQDRMFGRTRKDITFHERFATELKAVEVDQRQIEQVLLNIYVNAGHAMPDGGELYVSTRNETLQSHRTLPHDAAPGEYVKISVTDTGIGMEESVRRRVFEPFFTTKEMGRGTGLGLASAYGIIQNHRGFMTVYSEPGKGTTFNIYLPASSKAPVREKSVEAEIVQGSGTILLVDDEEMIVEVGGEMLESLGYTVLESPNGETAIDIYQARRDRIDLVILDMIMPGMSGGETFDRIKKINPDARILLASGYSINGQASAIMQRGCDGFIQKPFNLLELSLKISEILSRRGNKKE